MSEKRQKPGGRFLFWIALAGSACLLGGCRVKMLPFEDKVVEVEDDTKEEAKKAIEVEPSATPTPTPEPTATPIPVQPILDEAEKYALQYDYDSAIAYLEDQPEFAEDLALQTAARKYRNTKAACTEWATEDITHIFFHTLIVDTAKAFDGDEDEAGYNQMMTTVDEFNKIIQTMYDEGYVMVSLHDIAVFDEKGKMSPGSIKLPPGKTPFVLSQDDVSYYHYMDGDGFARKLIVTDEGEVKCEYVEDDGTVSIGDYDMVPLIDTFVKKHPDFSYRGRKGILAMTGYNGVLGYRTDIAYKTGENLQDNQIEFLNDNPDFDYDKEVEEATRVAEAMKAEGWEFASHTWGHRNATTASAEELKSDNERWEAYVKPILGDTDVIIFAFGADISNWEKYNKENAKFAYYKSRGYNYYCNVDSNRYWIQRTDDALRMGRRNLDGYRMYYNPEMCEDLFNVDDVWDKSRPTPVPEM